MSLRNLTRFRSYLISSISDLKRKTIAVLDQVFPEYASSFSNIFGKSSKEILISISIPQDFENITADKLEKVLENITMKKFAKRKIDELSFKATNSFGVKFCLDSFSLQIKLLIEQISFIESQVIIVEQEISILMEKINSPIISIEKV